MRNNKVQKLSNIVFFNYNLPNLCFKPFFVLKYIILFLSEFIEKYKRSLCLFLRSHMIYGARFSRVNGEKLGKVEVRAIFCFYLFTNVVDLFLSIHYAPTGILCFHWKAICGKIELFFETSLTPFFVNTNGPSTIKVNFYWFFNYF